VLWAGTDDGYIWITRDGGANWTNVTPRGIGDFARISIIDASRFDEGTAYVAANRFQLRRLHAVALEDHGLRQDVDEDRERHRADEFTRVIREDPERRGLLFAGTERGVWVSFNDGAQLAVGCSEPAAGAGARPRHQGRRSRGSARTAARSGSSTTSRRCGS
jgi:photosystem II stability/assembly factor-like uncharacterized protein